MTPFVAVVLAAVTTLSAQASETYFRAGWLGEYPTQFKATKNLTLKARLAPESLAEKEFEECKIKKGTKFGYSSGNKDAHYYTRSKVIGWRALRDINMEEFAGYDSLKGKVLRSGETVDEMTYLAEGICEVRFDGKIYQMTCPSNSEEGLFTPADPAYDPETAFDNHEEWLQLRCNGLKDGGYHWLLLKELQELFDNGSFVELPIQG